MRSCRGSTPISTSASATGSAGRFPARSTAGASKALRVSRYLHDDLEERHVRFSIWEASPDKARVEAAVSLEDDEAERLGQFLLDSAPPRRRQGLRAGGKCDEAKIVQVERAPDPPRTVAPDDHQESGRERGDDQTSGAIGQTVP